MIIEELINDMNEEIDNVQELKEIVGTPNGSQQQQRPLTTVASNEEVAIEAELPSILSDDSSVEELLPPPYCEVQIVEEIKKTELHKIEDNYTRENSYRTDDEAMKAMGSQRHDCLINAITDETIANDTNGDILDIPPPVIPPFEESEELEKSEGNTTEQSFPTPPPIDFDIEEPEWKEQATPPPDFREAENLASMLNRRESKPTSPGSKSLPSPPSPPSSASETGNETEAESKSSGDEQTAKIVPCGVLTTSTERAVLGVQDEDGDDSFFEASALENDPEIHKDIPPRPVPPVPRWLSQEEDEPENNEGFGGMQEPPATPVARDELALRRHRFFSDLLQAARSTAEHRVSFDPLGPLVHPGCEHDEREEHLEELVNRLESVTKRLEQVSTSAPIVQTQEIAVQTKSPSPERSLSLTEESSQSSSSSRESTVSGASVVEVVKNMSIAAYEDFLAGALQDYIQFSLQIGAEVASHCKLVQKAFEIQLLFLKTATTRSAPNQSEQMTLLGPTSAHIQKVQDFRESHRGSQFFNHLSAVSESISALGWVLIARTPVPYIKEMSNAGQFYTNRVLKDWKEKDKLHVEWCKAWVKTLTDLQQFVREHHTTGLVWAENGSVPPPPPPLTMPPSAVAPPTNDDRSALFAEINQGENITKNLKKVTSDMQTHKNTSLRTGPAPFKAPVVSNNSSSPVKTTPPANAPINKPPVFCRDGKKWLVEYHVGNKSIVIDNAEMNNVVYIFRCQDSSVEIKGKVNSVVMDCCRKSAVVVDSVVASIEFVNCESVKMQVLGKVPTISIDKTDGCQMYLNKDTLDVELITSKSSEMNVMVPSENEDYVEYPVPEQFKTVITNKGLSTVAVDSLG
ncbi:PREDICTED: adenylyl cyclase-associated protein [Ceratosolen solmsi marchali]|uniref:Adenylyl cyclase-associated protein n=1 Tax=Ceratosolen solmsi marchali TaxID=326594 RepID=A0AAJ7DTZ3_9HYME|nr:PREDICTED: adenylyl cyclase-associated protein [Ceratosolen solmsi marchali]